jgi:hypothetical protein
VAHGSPRFQKCVGEEIASLRSQIAISIRGCGDRGDAPYAFTERGVAMLSAVLNRERAIQVNIDILCAFVRMISNPVNG